MKNLNNLYLVSGRIDSYQEEDAILVVSSEQGLGHAKRVFLTVLLEEYEADHDKEDVDAMLDECRLTITSARPLNDLVESPITQDDPDLLERMDAQNDRVIHPGWGEEPTTDDQEFVETIKERRSEPRIRVNLNEL